MNISNLINFFKTKGKNFVKAENSDETPLLTFEPNNELKQCISLSNQSPDKPHLLSAVYRASSKGVLLLAVDRPPNVDQRGVVKESMSMQMLTSTSPDGGLVLQAFTDHEEALKRIGPSSKLGVIALKSTDVLKKGIEDNYKGIIVNAGGPWVIIPKNEIAKILSGKYA